MEENKDEKKEKKITDKNIRKKYILAIVIILGIFIIDQALKIYSINQLQGTNVNGIIGLTYKENYSGAFGVKFNSKTMYTLSSCVVLILVGSFIKQQAERLNKLTIGVLSVIFAGGLSNVIDKLIHGFVVDYLYINKFNLPVTSIAEILMILSWIILAGIFAKATYEDFKESKELKRKKIIDNDNDNQSNK